MLEDLLARRLKVRDIGGSEPSRPRRAQCRRMKARSQARVLWVACGAHALHDGFTDTLYVLLPLWQAQFALSYAAIGILRTLYVGVMAGLQVPVAGAAHRIGGAGWAARLPGRRVRDSDRGSEPASSRQNGSLPAVWPLLAADRDLSHRRLCERSALYSEARVRNSSGVMVHLQRAAAADGTPTRARPRSALASHRNPPAIVSSSADRGRRIADERSALSAGTTLPARPPPGGPDSQGRGRGRRRIRNPAAGQTSIPGTP